MDHKLSLSLQEAGNRISNQRRIQDTKRETLRELKNKMRESASIAGSLHAWWDLIFDIEAFLEGRPTLLIHTVDEWLSIAIKYGR
jgi:hypothetical protein